MKFIHCADVHLGSKMEYRLPKEKADERRAELRATFARVVEYARSNGINAILLAGDVFDGDRPLKRDKEFFYGVVKNNPDIDFLYLRGNHDVQNSYTEKLDNLKTFSDKWTSYEYGDTTVTGIECAPENAVGMYDSLSLDPQKKNIVMLHGQVADKSGMYKVDLKKLKNRNIDYLALGHLHDFSCGKLDERGVYAYPGCTEGRGFDEIGQKGFISLDITDKAVAEFVPACCRTIHEIKTDISDCKDMYAAVCAVKKAITCGKKDMLRITLTGEAEFDTDGIEREIEKQTARDAYFVYAVDATTQKYDFAAVDGDISLRGEFIRTVLGEKKYDDAQKQRIISAGLKALSGRELEL